MSGARIRRAQDAGISGPEVAVLHRGCSSAKSSPSGPISGRTQEKRETNRTPLIDLLVAAGACGELEVG